MTVFLFVGRPRWLKLFRELWLYRTRTLLVVLSIGVGVFAVGLIAGVWTILQREMPRAYAAVNPASAILYTDEFDESLLQAIRRVDGVAEAVGRRTLVTQVQVGAEQWARLELIALSSFDEMPINRLEPVAGVATPAARTVLIERAGLGLLNRQIGDALVIETTEGVQRTLDFTGMVYDPTLDPTTFSGTISGFIAQESLPWLGASQRYNQLLFTVADEPNDAQHIQAITDAVRTKVEKAGVQVYVAWVPPPGEHPTYSIVQAILFILSALGVATLVVSSFLVINSITALITQQTRQIGVMKTLGADAGQLQRLYQAMIGCYAIVATLIAMPLATYCAIQLAGFVAELLNFTLLDSAVHRTVYLLQAGVGLGTPMLSAWFPIRRGVGITVREALASRAEGAANLQAGWLERSLQRSRFLSRPLLLAFRNTFRRKGRLFLALGTLTLGMAISMAIFTLYSSVQATVADVSRAWHYDVTVYFTDRYLAARVQQLMRQAPAVRRVESWYLEPVRIWYEDGRESEDIQVEAPPPDTTLYQPTLLAGRWLAADEEKGIVINSQVLDVEPGLAVGDTITVKLGERKVTWEIVGITAGNLAGPRMYIGYDAFTYATRTVGETNAVRLALASTGEETIGALREYLQRTGLQVAYVETTADVRGQIHFQFRILLLLLTMMALLMLSVGGIGLTGTMSINVLERIAEIGVLRTIGATTPALLRLFLGEGMMIGVVSWVLALPLTWVLSRFLSAELGELLLQTPLLFRFSYSGIGISLVFVVLTAAIATFMPAWSATRLSVREIISYE